MNRVKPTQPTKIQKRRFTARLLNMMAGRKMSQADLSRAILGDDKITSRQTVHRWCSNTQIPSVVVLHRMAKYFNTTIDDMVDFLDG